jgi:hypothetical protein
MPSSSTLASDFDKLGCIDPSVICCCQETDNRRQLYRINNDIDKLTMTSFYQMDKLITELHRLSCEPSLSSIHITGESSDWQCLKQLE